MLIFNTTFHVEDEVKEKYLTFLKETYIPESINSGFLHQPRFASIHVQHELNGSSYSLQFCVKNIDTLNYWLSQGGQVLEEKMTQMFGQKVLRFVTLMDEIEL